MKFLDEMLASFMSLLEPESLREEVGTDPIVGVAGLHVVEASGSDHRLISKKPSSEDITDLMDSLDWQSGFFQVILVNSSGNSMEVGGSLNGYDGLSAVFRDPEEGVYRVTDNPPSSVRDMIAILLSFHRNDGRWVEIFDHA